MKTHISSCPTCGKHTMRSVVKDFHGLHKGVAYTVPALEFKECSSCGERAYSRQAMRLLEHASPAYSQKCRKAA